MRSARLLRALIWSLVLPRAMLAGKPVDRRPAEVLAKMSVAAGQLTAMSGELDVRYSATGVFNVDHKAKFWFAKPFRVKVVQVPVDPGAEGMELTYADSQAWLYQPQRKQVVEFDLTGGGPTDLLPRVFSLFAIPGFVQGALLSDVESHFAASVTPARGGWVLTLVANGHSLFRVALGIDRVIADVDAKTMLPKMLTIYNEGESGPKLLCRVGLSKLKFNPKLAASTFRFEAPKDVRRVPSTEILREWAGDAASRAGQQGLDVLNDVQERLRKLKERPWDF